MMRKLIPVLFILLLTLNSCRRVSKEIGDTLDMLGVLIVILGVSALIFAILRFALKKFVFSIGVYILLPLLIVFFGFVIHITKVFNESLKASYEELGTKLEEFPFPHELYYIFFGLIFLLLIYVVFDIIQVRKERQGNYKKKRIEEELNDELGLED